MTKEQPQPERPSVKPYVLPDEALLTEYQQAAKTGSTAARHRLEMLKVKLNCDPITGERPRV